MDDYPKEHLEGVTPLIFAVNAEFKVKDDNNLNGVTNGSGNSDLGRKSEAFALFCEYVASKKVDTTQASDEKEQVPKKGDPLSSALYENNTEVGSQSVGSSLRTSSRMPFSRKTPVKLAATVSETDFFARARMVTVSTRHAFPPSKDPHGTQNAVSKLNNALYSTRKHKLMPPHNPYQQAAQNQQNYVETPPEQTQIGQQQQAEPSPIASILAKNPVQGILPEGWIEKHSHALPSALVLVTTLDLANTVYEQAQLEQHLAKVIESITASSAKKRDCPIHIVCLIPKNPAMNSPKEAAMEIERLNNIRAICRLNNSSVTPLHHFTNKKGETIFVKEDFVKMEKSLHDDSTLYYLTQVRRCKRKHSLLRHDKFVDLLPFAARYCIKIAIFYEFQGWSDGDRKLKSVKYWREAYRNLQDYYLYLQGECDMRFQASSSRGLGRVSSDSQILRAPNSTSADDQINVSMTMGTGQQTSEGGESGAVYDGENPLSNDPSSLPPPPPPIGSPTQGSGVEVALVGSPRSGSGAVSIGATTPKLKPGKSIMNSSSEDYDTNQKNDEEVNMMTYSHDMIHQCRAVADLLNIKLLVTCYSYAVRSSSTSDDEQNSDGNVTFDDLAKQIRTHLQVFMSRPKSLSKGSVTDNKAFDCSWCFLEFVARQRLVLAQFLEREPIPSQNMGDLGAEAFSYCNPSKHYMAYAEVLTKLGLAVSDEVDIKHTGEMKDGFAERQRFVGGLGSHDLVSNFQKLRKIDHQALALENYSKAINLVESKNFPTCHVAKAHYLMADILVKKGRCSDALKHLNKARILVRKFPSLRVTIDIAMANCLKNAPSLHDEFKSLNIPAALIIDSGANKVLSTSAVRNLQKDISTNTNDMKPLNWQYDSESTQPLHFSLTFPSHLYATEGDTVAGLLHLHSNLPFAATLGTFRVSTNVGYVTIIDEDNHEILPKQTIRVPASLVIPNGCMKNIDERTLDKQAIKGSKPNTFGLTRIGGGVYTSKAVEEKLDGGLCVSCLTVELTLTIRNRDCISTIPIRLHNNHRGSFPRPDSKELGLRRSLLEEDNFVFSSWGRPEVFAVHNGPRCLRILRAQSDLKITDLTSSVTGNKVMEGTINRILLSLKSGHMEQCKDVKIRVTCSSWVELDGTETISLLDQTDTSGIIRSRLPCIVKASSSTGDIGHQSELIPGWVAATKADGEGGYHSEWIEISDMIDRDSEIISFFDLYRPLAKFEDENDHQCKTKFTVAVSYKQIRLDQSYHGTERDSVTQTYEGTVDWHAPLSAKFKILPGNESSFPSGSRHPTNFVNSNSTTADRNAVISGNNVGITCSLHSPGADNRLAVEITQVKFKKRTSEKQSTCDLSLVSRKLGVLDPEILYSPKSNTFCNKLTSGTNLKVAFTVRPEIKQGLSESVQVTSTHLGAVAIHFVPIPLYNVNYSAYGTSDEFLGYYGPLPNQNLPPSSHQGPLSYVETTPFDASFETVPSLPRVSNPFEVKYKVTNKTKLHQKLKISMTETEGIVSGMLVSGIINGDLNLGPMESTTISYSMMVTKIGKTILPDLSVSSLRYNTWIVHGIKHGTIYVMP